MSLQKHLPQINDYIVGVEIPLNNNSVTHSKNEILIISP